MTVTEGSIDATSLNSMVNSTKSGFAGRRDELVTEKTKLKFTRDQEVKTELESRRSANQESYKAHEGDTKWNTEGMSDAEKAVVTGQREKGE
jgi:hypothetical protein